MIIDDKTTMTDTLIFGMCALALEAGINAIKHYHHGVEVDTKADNSPVTLADREGEDIISAGLKTLCPDIQIIGEEAASVALPSAIDDVFFLLDPLDGTKEFINQRTDFTVNIGLIAQKIPIAGVVYAPALGRLFFTRPDKGANKTVNKAYEMPLEAVAENLATLNIDKAKQIMARKTPDKGAVVVASRSHRAPQTDIWLKTRKVQSITSAGSSLKFCLLATGEADLYPRHGRTMEWDTAASHAVLLAAGGTVTQFDGTPLTYGKLERGLDNPFFLASGAS